MKLDTKYLRYLTAEDWRVLTAVEMGSKNHEIVPTTLIIKLSSLRSGSGVHKSISTLAKANLIARTKNAKYDGYRLTYGGLDYLSLHTHLKRDTLYSLGSCIGTGKESDIYICAPPPSPSRSKQIEYVLKIHRLGRISFRTIKTNRDYLHHRQSASWMYMSHLAAQKEFIFMRALYDNDFRVPEPVGWNRHTVVMSLIDGVPLKAVKEVGNPASLYGELIGVTLRLARFGLIHGDFNEFNIMIQEIDKSKTEEAVTSKPGDQEEGLLEEERKEDEGQTEDAGEKQCGIPWIIDFPQAVSIDHANAQFYFNRDVQCIKTFFERRFHFTSSEPGPFFKEAKKAADIQRATGGKRLDVEVEASGFSRKMAKELEKYMQAVGVEGDGHRDNVVGLDESSEENDSSEARFSKKNPTNKLSRIGAAGEHLNHGSKSS